MKLCIFQDIDRYNEKVLKDPKDEDVERETVIEISSHKNVNPIIIVCPIQFLFLSRLLHRCHNSPFILVWRVGIRMKSDAFASFEAWSMSLSSLSLSSSLFSLLFSCFASTNSSGRAASASTQYPLVFL